MNPKRLLQHFNEIAEAPDAVPRLRRFILDLAVRGKLVEQNPEDEPAAELLKRILREKDQLEKDGTIRKPMLLAPVEGIKTPFEIPSSWKWTRLGDSIIDHKGGGTPSKNNSIYWDGEIFWASVKDIGKSKYVDQTIDRITKAGLDNSSSNLIPPGNLIVVTRMGLGKVSINRVPIAINQDLRALFVSNLSAIDFYYIFFRTASYEGTGLTVKGIKIEELLNFPFPLPPLSEQHRIVAKVNELRALCDELEAAQQKRERRRDRLVAATLNGLGMDVIGRDGSPSRPDDSLPKFFLTHLPRLTTRPEHIQQLRQTILNLAVRGKLVPQDSNDEPADWLISRIEAERKRRASVGRQVNTQSITDFGDGGFPIPQSWRWTRLGFVTNVLMGQSPPGETYNTHGEGIPLINGPVEFSEGPFGVTVLNQYTTAPTKLCKKGDLLLCVRGSTTGRTNIAGFDACIGRGVAALQPLYTDQFVRLFVWLWRDKIIEMGRGIAFPSISRQQIEDLLIPIPPPAEQHRIVTKVEELMKLCDGLESQLNWTASNRRQLLEATLQEALSRKNSHDEDSNENSVDQHSRITIL